MVRCIHQVARCTKINIKCTTQVSKNYKFWHPFCPEDFRYDTLYSISFSEVE